MSANTETRSSYFSQQSSRGSKQQRKLPTTPKPILSNKQTGVFKIIKEGEDVTPEPLNPLRPETTIRRISGYDLTGDKSRSQSITNLKLFQSQSISRLQTEIHKQTLKAQSQFHHSYISSDYLDDVVIEPAKEDSLTESLLVEDHEQLGGVTGEDVQSKPMPTHISIILSETSTFFLLDLPSKTVERGTPEAAAVEDENERYIYLTEGKGRNRKMVNAEAQTTQILMKTRSTEAERIKRRHNQTFASNWEMFDTYEQDELARKSQAGIKLKKAIIEDDEEEVEDDGEELSPKKQTQQTPLEELQMNKLMQNKRFLQAICIIERLLANNNFNEQQKRFRGLSDPDPFRENIEYKYRLDLLWTFSNKETSDRCVTAMCWNDANLDILAVGYGKFLYTDVTPGMVLIWNVKNPVQPERFYHFEQPVTTLNFSKNNPNVLGVGFYDGVVRLLDVSAREPKVIGISSKDCPSFEPIWQIAFYQGSDYFKNEEQIITSGEDGRISYFRQQDTVELIYSQIMRIARPEGKLRGVTTLRRCHVPGIPISRYASALTLRQHPIDLNIYYVGTSEGTIHKCSRNYYHQHLDLFLAHDGPVYEMKFSPFCNRLFLTCGDDWKVRLWVDGIVEPLFTLTKAMQSVQDADWSPTHSTIVANICGTEICIWDLQRKTYKPQSVTMSPSNCRNTLVQFTASGRCLVVGDIEGNVHIFALEDMPFPAFFQDDLLTNSIIRGLITRPDLIRRLKKLGSLNFDKSKFQKYFQ